MVVGYLRLPLIEGRLAEAGPPYLSRGFACTWVQFHLLEALYLND